MQTLIVIPARIGSSRFPAKPLHVIEGKTLLQRVVEIAAAVSASRDDVDYVVATDHADIVDLAQRLNAPSVMTDPDLPSGSDRALAAADLHQPDADFIINLQGDAPFTPISYIEHLIAAASTSTCDVITPIVQLSWEELDMVRARKKDQPFSGTSCVFDRNNEAKWFSKTLLPAIRHEADLRAASPLSPVWRHIGLYGYKRAALKRFVSLPTGTYEALEGLEQLRFLENGMRIEVVKVAASPHAMWGVDTPEDADLAAEIIRAHGEPLANT
ncbi:MAG: manno-octulosonate cytidylyltransferase [Henriciella sp.]|nr:manno-octulosonate cytidylyltransferase [Henriciella sp.]